MIFVRQPHLLLCIIMLLAGCGQSAVRNSSDPNPYEIAYRKRPIQTNAIMAALLLHYGAVSNASGLLGVRWEFKPKSRKAIGDTFHFHVDYWVGYESPARFAMRLKFQQTLGQVLDAKIDLDGSLLIYAPTEKSFFKSTMQAVFSGEGSAPQLIGMEALMGPWPISDDRKKIIQVEDAGQEVVVKYFDPIVGMEATCYLDGEKPIVKRKVWHKGGSLFAEATYEGEREFSGGIKRPKKVTWIIPGEKTDMIFTVGVKIFDQTDEIPSSAFSLRVPPSAKEVTEKELTDAILKRMKSGGE